MNDQYPASPNPGQPDRRNSQQSAWGGGENAPGGFGKRPLGPFSSPESNSGPFSSGGTTSLFQSGRKQDKSAWGTPVPDAQRPANDYSRRSGYDGYAAPGSPGDGAGRHGGKNKNLQRQGSSAGPRFVIGLVIIVVSMVISFGAGLVSFFSDDDPTPVPRPTFSSPIPAPHTSGVSIPNPLNGQNADGSVTVGVWRVEKVEFLPDATERLANISDLPELDEGFRFAGVKMRFINEGSEVRSPAYDVGVTVYYGDGGGDRSWEEMSIRAADSVRGLGDIEPGTSVEGWYYVQVPLNYVGGKIAFFDYEGVTNIESDMMLP